VSLESRRIISFTLPDDLIVWLDFLTDLLGVSRSELLVQVLSWAKSKQVLKDNVLYLPLKSDFLNNVARCVRAVKSIDMKT